MSAFSLFLDVLAIGAALSISLLLIGLSAGLLRVLYVLYLAPDPVEDPSDET